ncbi:MAG: (Fe-S)-binding protein [Chloroflexota bacterium]
MRRKTFTSRPQRVALFVTCMVDMIYPQVGMATVELLEKQGLEVVFIEEQTCCGQPAFNAGYRDEARQLAKRFVNIFEPLLSQRRVDAIVAPSGSCTAMVSHFYHLLLSEDSTGEEQYRAARVAEATFELTEFLVDVLGVSNVQAHFEGRLTYHACCHLLRELHVDEQPRTLLRHVQNASLIELAEAEECCGFGGLFSVKNSDISTAMGQRKTRNLANSGADVVTLCDVSCMTHLNGLLERQAQPCRAVHIAEVLNNQVKVDREQQGVSQNMSPQPNPVIFHDVTPPPSSQAEYVARNRSTEKPQPSRRWQDSREG